ncbi:MAG: hypothetical protein RLZZ384_166, partial [Pseudomonadota bacterium]
KGCLLFSLLPLTAMAQLDPATIQKIRTEGLEKSQVMDIAFNLTDKSGNRLANSEGYTRAANYAKDVLTKNGAENAVIAPWGEFGKGWELEKMYFAMTAPYYKPMMVYPKTWTRGTKGLKSAEVLLVDIKDSLAVMAYKGKLKGKIILPDMSYDYVQSFKADAQRYTDDQLAKMAGAHVITTVSSTEKAEFVKTLGADDIVFYNTSNVTDEVNRLTQNRGADLVFDTVGSDVFKLSIGCTAHFGRLITILDASHLDLSEARMRNLLIGFELMLTPMLRDLDSARDKHVELLKKCADLIDAGTLKIHVSEVLPLEHASRAHDLIEAGRTTGKLVLSI